MSWWVRRVLAALVRGYQLAISPLFRPSCRFVPSCSDYALEVLQRKPLLKGVGLIVWRLCRCQPLCRGGFDPVPPDRKGAGRRPRAAATPRSAETGSAASPPPATCNH